VNDVPSHTDERHDRNPNFISFACISVTFLQLARHILGVYISVPKFSISQIDPKGSLSKRYQTTRIYDF